ncbi:MAG: class I SAM-dependent methyltransferase [Pseudomonadota bacterium]|jgi:SAM-dependent methyltransferase|nr:class I SAM-dependent methyltransferase [Pseudomonadota bacterium]
MMQRLPEPELMDEAEQAYAYAQADFDAPHEAIIDHFTRAFAGLDISGKVLDLGCGPADITVRFVRRYPRCRIDGVDGAAAMLNHARERLAREGLGDRVRLLHRVLPTEDLPRAHYATVVSNSLLHHLHEPAVLWNTVRQTSASGARVFIADLMRPRTIQSARDLVNQYAGDEPAVLQRDFYNSLRAAFTVEEVRAQLAAAGLSTVKTDAISDRHLVAWGVCE